MALKVNIQNLIDSETAVILTDKDNVDLYYNKLKEVINIDGIPVNIMMEKINSGGFFSSKSEEMLVIRAESPGNSEITVIVSASSFGKFMVLSVYLLNGDMGNAIKASYVNIAWESIRECVGKALSLLNMEKFDKGFVGIS